MNAPATRIRSAYRPLFYVLATLVAAGLAMGAGAAGFILWGAYNVSALQQHTAPVYLALDAAMKRSISQRAEEIEAPPLENRDMIERGLRQYRRTCIHCHGAPGVARGDIGKGMTPMPANLVNTARNRTPAEIFWTIRNGIKMTGMPAWRFEYTDEEIWDIVAFVRAMPRLSPAEYKAIPERGTAPEHAAVEGSGIRGSREPRDGDLDRGRLALHSYACVTCHAIPGVVGPEADVGPPLAGIARRHFIAGALPNTFDNLVRWIQDPVAVDPLTAMPDMGVSEQDAVDIAAYLSTLREED